MTYEQAVRKAAHRDWGSPSAAAACGLSWHCWREFHNASYQPSAIQWISLGNRYGIEPPQELLDRWRSERAAA